MTKPNNERVVDRRRLLGAIAVVPVAALVTTEVAGRPRTSADTTIADIEIFQVKVNKRGNWVLVRLQTKSGLTGIGDASHGGDDVATITYLKQLVAQFRGRDIFEVEAFRDAATKLVRETGGRSRAAGGAIEHCLWDLIGKVTGQPAYNLFGGKLRDRIPLYANINRSADPRTPEGFAAMARRAFDAGFDAVKLAPFDEMPRMPVDGADIEAGVRHGIACAQAVRDVLGASGKLMIDAHSRFTLAQGCDLLRRFEPLHLTWLEEVTAERGFADLAAINSAATMPTAGGEILYGVQDFYRYIAAGAVDIVMPDVKHCGGMLELRRIAAIAEGAGLLVSPHGPASPVGNVAAAHVVAGIPNFNILEFAFGEVPWRAELLTPHEDVSGGSLALSSAPGFGVELNEKALSRYAV